MRTPRVETPDGFTLIEVMVAMLVFLIGFLAVISLQNSSIRSLYLGNQNAEAVFLAQEQIQVLLSLPYADGVAPFATSKPSYVNLTDPLDDAPGDAVATWHPRAGTGPATPNGFDAQVVPQVLTREGSMRFEEDDGAGLGAQTVVELNQVDPTVEYVRYWRVKRGGSGSGGAPAATGTCVDFHSASATISSTVTAAMNAAIGAGLFDTGVNFAPNNPTNPLTWGSPHPNRGTALNRVDCAPAVVSNALWIEVTVYWLDAEMRPHFVRMEANKHALDI